MYIRFQTGVRCHYTGRSLGIFYAAGQVQDRCTVPEYLTEPLRDSLVWFNNNLKVPRRDTIPRKCLFWFDCGNAEVLGRVWELIGWLRMSDVYVIHRKCRYPGKIIYRDDHQVAAIPGPSVQRILRLRR